MEHQAISRAGGGSYADAAAEEYDTYVQRHDNGDGNEYDEDYSIGGEGGLPADHDNVLVHEDDDGDFADLVGSNESEKRQQRRKAQKKREREQRRRREAEGSTMNVLTVNERTKKPYGLGVDDWKRELALLSRSLNPTILNINHQPEGALEKIKDWIQHTWYYTTPVHDDIIKAIIARAVRVRRYNIWRSISNGEEKPEDLSDKTWQILKKLLKSPAHKQKSEDCKRANASRVHFGRTGPSGVVGVKARLEGIFNRSPVPEEIKEEMRRNKGYGGRLHKRKEKLNIPTKGGKRVLLIENGSEEEDKDEYVGNEAPRTRPEACEEDMTSNDVVEEQQALSDQQVLNHPAVLQMKLKLEEYQSNERANALLKGKAIAKTSMKGDSSDDDDSKENRGSTSRSTRRRVVYD